MLSRSFPHFDSCCCLKGERVLIELTKLTAARISVGEFIMLLIADCSRLKAAAAFLRIFVTSRRGRALLKNCFARGRMMLMLFRRAQ